MSILWSIVTGTVLVYGSVCVAMAAVLLAAAVAVRVARKVRKRRADRAWAASAAWRMHVLAVREWARDREGLTGADFEEWAQELCREEPAP